VLDIAASEPSSRSQLHAKVALYAQSKRFEVPTRAVPGRVLFGHSLKKKPNGLTANVDLL
jgi:hypothetical protein